LFEDVGMARKQYGIQTVFPKIQESMNWKEKLKYLESIEEWDIAIEFMQKIVRDYPEDMDVYLSVIYLLMNLIVEEDYDSKKHDYYAALLKEYFDISYDKFSENSEYLFYVGRIACMSEWYFDIEIDDASSMISKAATVDPSNLVYQWTHFSKLSRVDPHQKEVIQYAKLVLQEDSPIKKELMSKGSRGEYILGMMTYWSQKVLSGKNPYK